MRLWLVTLCFAGGLLSPGHLLGAQELRVLVLDALSGQPQPKVEVEYFCTRPQHNSEHIKALTDPTGIAKFTNPCSDGEEIEISIYPPDQKKQCGVGVITLKEILSSGAVSNQMQMVEFGAQQE